MIVGTVDGELKMITFQNCVLVRTFSLKQELVGLFVISRFAGAVDFDENHQAKSYILACTQQSYICVLDLEKEDSIISKWKRYFFSYSK